MSDETIESFESVWDAIEPSAEQASHLRMRADLMFEVRRSVSAWGLSQGAAAKRLGVSQPRLSDLMRGRIDKFSLDALVTLAERAGLNVRVSVS